MIFMGLMLFLAAPEESLTADSIMARLAENQDRAEHLRTAFVYHQNVLVRIHRANGKLAREEYSEYTVTPTPKGTNKERVLFRGKYVEHGKSIDFDTPGFEHKGIDIDANLGESLTESVANDRKSRDGIEHDLFPLTSRQQEKYNFRLEGAEDYRGTPVYKITFVPKKRVSILDDDDENQGQWVGEALVHRNEYQPVLITTSLAAQIPLWVKTALGTDVKQLGFKVTYQKCDEGLWFPVSYGGEFKLKVLFLYSRRIGISMQNSGFQKAAVKSEVSFAEIP
jgi:hypothetical protein